MPYGSTPEEDLQEDQDPARVIGQVSGPKSMSEYNRDFGLEVDPQFEADNMGRRNGYELPRDIPNPVIGGHKR